MKVIFTHKSGRQQEMQERFAIPLQKLGRGTYMTRDMRANEVPALEVAQPLPAEPAKELCPAEEESEPKPVKRRSRKTKTQDEE